MFLNSFTTYNLYIKKMKKYLKIWLGGRPYSLNATPGSPRFNEICDMLHENSVMFRDANILPDKTYTHVNNGSQTCSWRIILQCPMFCPSLMLTATPSMMLLVQITVLLQLHLTLTTANDTHHRETKKQAHKLEI